MPAASSRQPTIHRRSRNGCYTCRVRKVRCEVAKATSDENTNGDTSICSNCQRLGFQCRWNPPASGETYTPPPKRRRTTVQRRVNTNENLSNTPHQHEMNMRGSATPVSSNNRPQNLQERGTETFGHAFYNNFGMLGDIALDSDLNFGCSSFSLDLAGEGLDFIPLPEVDPSILQPSIDQSLVQEVEDTSRQYLVYQDVGDSTSDTGSNLSPSMSESNRLLIQHYLEVMKGYSKVDDRSKDANNLFISAFSQSLCFPPLFYAILAFSASHLSIKDSSYTEQAETLDRLALESFDVFQREHDSEVEGLLSALFVRVKKVHITAGSLDTFMSLVAAASNIISAKQEEQAIKTPSPLTKRIILRLAILDARAAAYRLGGGTLIERLRSIPTFSFLFDRNITKDMSRGGVGNLVRANVLRVRVADLDKRIYEQNTAEFVTMPPIRMDEIKSLYSDIRREIDAWERELETQSEINGSDVLIEDEVLEPTTYNSYVVLSALHSNILYLCDIYPLPQFDRELSVRKILAYQLRVRHDPSRINSPSSIFPSSLFQAGLCTTDPIHRDWVIEVFKKSEEWGVFVQRARELLESMLRMKAKGALVDISTAMDQVTGRFVI